MKIALCSPNKNLYSETFIQAHKSMLHGEIFYYYDGNLPHKLEDGLVINSRKRRLVDLVKGHLNLNRFSLAEQAVITSFKENDIQLVFAEYGEAGEQLVPICKELELPLIVHFHGFDASKYHIVKKHNNYKKLFSYARFIVVVSKEMKQDLLKLGCPSNKIILNPCGPREAFFKVKPEFKTRQFISVGRFVDKKAPYYLILAFRRVLKKYPDANLTLAGVGELYNSCKNLVEYFGLQENIELPGVLSEEEIIDRFHNSLAYIQHSITALDGDKEGTPVSILEAGAAGLPVVSTKHAGIKDVIKDEYNGYLVEEHEVEQMAVKIMMLLEEPLKAKEMGANARKNIKENYSLDRHIGVLNDIIAKTVENI